MNTYELMMLIAIVAGPILAVQIQKMIDKANEDKNRKMWLFSNLMATRAMPVSPLHVEALNRIDIEFYKNKKVTDAWKLLLDNFGNYPLDPKASDFQVKLNSCSEKSNELLIDLLYQMGKSLGYDFDKVHLKRGVYFPKGHTDLESEQQIIRRALLEILVGKKSLPIEFTNLPDQDGPKTPE